MSHPLILFCYLVAAVLFIVGLKRLSSPKSAASGNLVAAVGMLLAIAATLLDREIVSFTGLIVAMAIGSAIGAATAYTVKMTAMPQMVAVFNGFGGGASALVASAELLRRLGAGEPPEVAVAIPIVLHLILRQQVYDNLNKQLYLQIHLFLYQTWNLILLVKKVSKKTYKLSNKKNYFFS